MKAPSCHNVVEAEGPDLTDAEPGVIFLPTLEEIRAACLQIQATWSPEERRRRLVGWEGGAA